MEWSCIRAIVFKRRSVAPYIKLCDCMNTSFYPRDVIYVKRDLSTLIVCTYGHIIFEAIFDFHQSASKKI